MSVGRQKAVFVVLVVAGAVLGLLAATRPWVVAHVADLSAATTLKATGRQAAGAVPAVSLVGLAGAVAVLSTRRLGRLVAGAALVLAGAAAATTSVGVLRGPESAVVAVVTTATGRTGADVTASVTPWPVAGVLAGVLIALGGALAVVRAGAWGGLSARYDTPATTTGSTTGSTTAAAGEPGTPTGTPTGTATDEPAGDPAEDPGLAWDQLTRGEDPTR